MARKSKRSKKATDEQDAPEMADGGGLIQIPDDPEPDPDENITVDALTGVVKIEHEDGSVTIDPTGASLWQEPEGDPSHEENLALKIDPIELNRIANELLEAIQSDKQDRSQWEQMRAKCVELMGMKLEDPKGDVSRSAMGMSTSVVRDPVLAEAVERFRANAYAELCPASGPVKVVRWGIDNTLQKDELADALQSDLNYYLTTTASEYYDDMYYMLWWTGLASGTFKKIYSCPLRRRPVSEFVDGTALIVPSNATDLKNAGRVTHEVKLRKSIMRAMQMAGVYRDILLTEPLPPMVNAVQAKAATIEGKNPQPQRPEDTDYTVFECYTELDIKGFEHKEKGKPTGLPLPYRVTIEDTSKQILEIRRNWDEEEGDEDDDAEEAIVKTANIPFVLFPYSTGLSRIYGSGLGQLLGNLASALTALLRISIDNGIMGNYPGVVKAKGPGRDLVNEIMVPPGGCVEIDTGGMPIQQFMMSLPYKDISGNVAQFMEQLRGVAQRLGSTAELPVGEGKQDAPVGTTIAMIEQATKIEGAVHKRLHAAQSEEFRLLVKLFKADPEALWRKNPRPNLGTSATDAEKQARVAKFRQALDCCDVTPMADPNVPSDMHRNLMAMGFQQMTAMDPDFNQVEVKRYVAKQTLKMGDSTFNGFLVPANMKQQMPNPALLKLGIDKQNADTNQMKALLQHKQAEASLQQKSEADAMKLAAQHHQAMASNQLPIDNSPTPFEEQKFGAEMSLKHRQVALQEAKLGVDTHNAQADRDSKEAVEAMKIAQTAGVHPESTPIMDQQMNQMGDFLAPAAAKSVARGGAVNAEEPSPEAYERARQIKIALEIAAALQQGDPNYSPYLQ